LAKKESLNPTLCICTRYDDYSNLPKYCEEQCVNFKENCGYVNKIPRI